MVEDFIPNNSDHVEGLLGRDRVDQHVAVDADEMLRIQYAVFVLVRWGVVSDGEMELLQAAGGESG